jgi:hypothetical protein
VASAFFALICAAGAWSAWRRNPMYSTGLTVRLVVAIVLGGAGFSAATVGVAELTEHRSPAIEAGALGAVLLFGCLALIWLALHFGLPKTASLPASVTLVRTNRAKLTPWVRKFAWTILGFAILALVLPGDAKVIAYICAGIVGLMGILILFSAYLIALRFDRALTSVERDPWIHWRYSPQDWKAWSAIEVARIEATAPNWQWSRDWKVVAISLATVAVLYAVNFTATDWRELAAFTAGSWLLIVGLIAGADRYGRSAPYRLRRLLATSPPETYAGAAGLYADGVFTEWETPGNYLLRATVDEREPRSLAFVFARYVSGGATSEVRHSALIPDGAEGDVAKLQTALAEAFPKARIALASPLQTRKVATVE